MIFDRLNTNLLGRLMLLLAALAGGGYAALHHAYGLALVALGALLVLVVALARYLTRGQQQHQPPQQAGIQAVKYHACRGGGRGPCG